MAESPDTIQGNENRVIEQTIASIEQAARTEERRSRRLRWSNSLFSFSSAILGVGAPTLVTYFAQDATASPIMKLVAILAAAFAGATTVLLNTFRWGQRYGQSSLAAIALRELASSTQLQLQDIKRTVKTDAFGEKFHQLNHDAQKRMYDIVRGVIQNEAAVFSREEARTPTPASASKA